MILDNHGFSWTGLLHSSKFHKVFIPPANSNNLATRLSLLYHHLAAIEEADTSARHERLLSGSGSLRIPRFGIIFVFLGFPQVIDHECLFKEELQMTQGMNTEKR